MKQGDEFLSVDLPCKEIVAVVFLGLDVLELGEVDLSDKVDYRSDRVDEVVLVEEEFVLLGLCNILELIAEDFDVQLHLFFLLLQKLVLDEEAEDDQLGIVNVAKPAELHQTRFDDQSEADFEASSILALLVQRIDAFEQNRDLFHDFSVVVVLE